MRDVDKALLIKQSYPGMDTALFSKTRRPDYYGVQLVKDAKLIIGELHKRQKKHYYLSVRTTHAFRDEVTRELRKEGYTTLQSGVIAVLHEWLEKRKTAAPTAVNQDTMTNNQ